MYCIGEKVVYETTGVCEITDIRKLTMRQADKGAQYYVLRPVRQGGTIYCPVNSEKVFMRPVISKKEAEEIIDSIPGIDAEAYENANLQLLSKHYRDILKTHDCARILELTMSIFLKKQDVSQRNKKLGQVDEAYMKQAEELLFSELSEALGIPFEGVGDYISERINK